MKREESLENSVLYKKIKEIDTHELESKIIQYFMIDYSVNFPD